MRDAHKSYDAEFYQRQMGGSYTSATKIVGHLAQYFVPDSVIDVGCGRGTWLKAFKNVGSNSLQGIDGAWNTQVDMVDEDIIFHQADLNNPSSINIVDRADLAVSLEVAEHLKPECSKNFVEALTSLSDVILFSAAYVKQDGKDHINEHEHSFWADLFARHGYRPYDLFRPVFWGDPDVGFWYQQNVFLYVKEGSRLNTALAQKSIFPLLNLQFMNCIHPRLYARYTKPPKLKRLITKIQKRLIP